MQKPNLTLAVIALLSLGSSRLHAETPTPAATPTPSPAATPTPPPGSDFTGEQPANRLTTPGPMMPEADATVLPMPELPVLTRILYVSPTGDRKAKGLTPETAVPPQTAAWMTQPGDLVLFAEGEYVSEPGKTLLAIERSGAPGLPIVYAPMPGAKVTLRANGGWEAIKVAGASHIVIRNFRVIGSSANVTMEEALAEMSNLKNPRTCGNGIGIDWRPQDKKPPSHVTVRDCVVSDFPGGGIFANHTDYLTFENNVVFRCAFWSPYANSGLSVYQPIDVDDNTGYKIIIRNNVSFGNYQNIPFFHSNRADPSKRKYTDGNGIILDDFLSSQGFGGGTNKPYAGRTLVANNVVFANGGSGIHAFKSDHVDVINNYAWDNNRHPFLKDGQIFGNRSRNMRILNNVLIGPPGKPVTTSHQNEGLTQNNNLYATLDGSAPKFVGEQAQNIIAPPGLEIIGWAEGKREIRVAPDSPLRGAATPDAAITDDFFGVARPEGKLDIGPFVLEGR
jgi:hypothetical protein